MTMFYRYKNHFFGYHPTCTIGTSIVREIIHVRLKIGVSSPKNATKRKLPQYFFEFIPN